MNRPNHTTVVAYLALFLALGAGTAFAAGQLAKNSVGSKQLKKNAVTGAKVKKDAITSAKVKDASLLGADLADGDDHRRQDRRRLAERQPTSAAGFVPRTSSASR